MTCPKCGCILYEVSKLVIPSSINGPDEHIEYSECYICYWSDMPTEDMEIPF